MSHTEPQHEQQTPTGEESAGITTFTACGSTVFDLTAAADQRTALAEALRRAKRLDILLAGGGERGDDAFRQLNASGRDRGLNHVLLATACHVPLGAPVNIHGGKHAGKVGAMAGAQYHGRGFFWVLIPGHGPGLVKEGDFQVMSDEPVDTHAIEAADVLGPQTAPPPTDASGAHEEFPALLDPDEPRPEAAAGGGLFDELLGVNRILNDDDAETRAALLSKNGMTALLTVTTAEGGGVIIRTDPRIGLPTSRFYPDAGEALRWYRQSLRTSVKNGWTIIYDGVPSEG